MRIAVDVKNLALYHGGIAQFFAPLLAHWIEQRPQHEFLLVGPPFDVRLLHAPNWQQFATRWPDYLPRPLRHPAYDNFVFPQAIRRLRPDFVFSPYHDVRLPQGVPSALMIHDTCLDELKQTYPRGLRLYYLSTLQRNLKHAHDILTVSKSSSARIQERYRIAGEHIHVVYNACHPDFLAASENGPEIAEIRGRLSGSAPLLFYPGGAEFRKNVSGLVGGFARLVDGAGDSIPALAVTGRTNAVWQAALQRLPKRIRARIIFLGYLDNHALKQHYVAADAVIYPSLCEGFGRVCLECMVTGTPVACTDLPVMREIAGDYPFYFNPHCEGDIAAKTRLALDRGRTTPVFDKRFTTDNVQRQFLAAMDQICRP